MLATSAAPHQDLAARGGFFEFRLRIGPHLPAGRNVVLRAAASLAQTEATQSSSPGQAIPGTLGVSPFSGSVPAKLVPGVMPLSLQDAIDRGLKQNLGLLLSKRKVVPPADSAGSN